MRDLVIAWARLRWPGCRVLHELVLGKRRADLAFVCDKDLIVVEIKSSQDTLDRAEAQLLEYGRYAPEVWLAVAPKWEERATGLGRSLNLLIVGDELEVFAERIAAKRGFKRPKPPRRDELVCSRMIELLWRDECARIAQRTDVIPGSQPSGESLRILRPMLARLLTGNEIMREVCHELRERAGAFGYRSDTALERSPTVVRVRAATPSGTGSPIPSGSSPPEGDTVDARATSRRPPPS